MLMLAIPLFTFWALFLVSSVKFDYRQSLRDKPRVAWVMDGLGLFLQGWLIPLLQAYLLLPVFKALVPTWEGALPLPQALGFCLSFIVVDYLYYWNHRLLHSRSLWPWHRAHHSAQTMDIFVSSRNSLWTHLLICYVWIHGLAIFLLHDDRAYLLGVAISSALDLWRHSNMRLSKGLSRTLGAFLILPEHHAWHHAMDSSGHNFGANFNLWDKLHGTWQDPQGSCFAVGDSEGYQLRYRDLIGPIRK